MTRLRRTLAAMVAAGAVGLASPLPAADSDTSAPDIVDKVRSNRHELLQSMIGAPEDKKLKADLEATIRRLQSIRIAEPGHRPPPAPAAAPEASGSAEATGAEAIAGKVTAPDRLAEAQLEQLRELAPATADDAIALGDALYLAGHWDEAYRFYDRAETAKEAPEETRAWALFQKANCRRRTAPAEAVPLYEQVVSKYATTPWREAARSHAALIKWSEQVRPREALAESLGSPGRETGAPVPAPTAVAGPAASAVATPSSTADVPTPASAAPTTTATSPAPADPEPVEDSSEEVTPHG